MARIKKTGLDYFPLDTQFVNNRTVRRIMKHRGDAALAVLINIYCAIYSGQGYYVEASDVFYEDLADNLFTLDTDDVRQIVGLALEYGMFHQGLYSRYGILTSEGIQRQYLFSAKRRSTVRMDGRFCLLPPEELPSAKPRQQQQQEEDGDGDGAGCTAIPAAEVQENVQESPEMLQKPPINAEKTHPGTHSIAQHSTEKHSIAQPLPQEPSPAAVAAAGGSTSCGKGAGEEAATAVAPRTKREYTQQDIDAMTPPADGVRRNLDGLRENLRLWRVPPGEQYAIVLKSNFGAIGHPLWQGFYTLRASRGKIRQPGKYLLSLCCRRQE